MESSLQDGIKQATADAGRQRLQLDLVRKMQSCQDCRMLGGTQIELRQLVPALDNPDQADLLLKKVDAAHDSGSDFAVVGSRNPDGTLLVELRWLHAQ